MVTYRNERRHIILSEGAPKSCNSRPSGPDKNVSLSHLYEFFNVEFKADFTNPNIHGKVLRDLHVVEVGTGLINQVGR